jgi:hypothetical protein
MPQRKRDIERGCGFSQSSVRSRLNSVANPQSNRLAYTAGSENWHVAFGKEICTTASFPFLVAA